MIRNRLDLFACLTHRHTDTGPREHGDIVLPVTDRHDFARIKRIVPAHRLEARILPAAGRNDIDEVRMPTRAAEVPEAR